MSALPGTDLDEQVAAALRRVEVVVRERPHRGQVTSACARRGRTARRTASTRHPTVIVRPSAGTTGRGCRCPPAAHRCRGSAACRPRSGTAPGGSARAAGRRSSSRCSAITSNATKHGRRRWGRDDAGLVAAVEGHGSQPGGGVGDRRGPRVVRRGSPGRRLVGWPGEALAVCGRAASAAAAAIAPSPDRARNRRRSMLMTRRSQAGRAPARVFQRRSDGAVDPLALPGRQRRDRGPAAVRSARPRPRSRPGVATLVARGAR